METTQSVVENSSPISTLENADDSENQIITCVICHGDGYSILEQGKYLCTNCEGKGKYPAGKFTKEQTDDCPTCDGSGEVYPLSNGEWTCDQCDGTGQVEVAN